MSSHGVPHQNKLNKIKYGHFLGEEQPLSYEDF